MTTPGSAPKPRVHAAVAMLRARHERVTSARLAILEILDTTQRHLNAEEIVALAAEQTPGVHRATIYRALSKMSDLDLVSHTHLGGSAAVYHLTVPDPQLPTPTSHHAHLQCTTCGSVIDVPVDTLRPVIAQLERDLKFRFEPHHTALLGTCANCRRE